MTRPYQLKQRAQRQEQTRQRIVEATVRLHETLGPARTTISAVAAQAGVERLTVYRHFPDEETLFTACTGHYLAAHPLPDPVCWMHTADPEARMRVALTETYAYYQRTEPMLHRALADLPDLPVMQRILAPYFAYWEQVRDGLAEGWGLQGRSHEQLRAVVTHLLDFHTWHAFIRQQHLADDELVALAVQFVHAIASA